MAETLDTDGFIHLLARFLARRGLPKLIRSDNGSAFVGAAPLLREQMEQWNQERIRVGLAARGIKWEFNTPFASHHGGVWERQIRTVRKVLHSIARQQTLTDESLRTFLTVAEGIVNNRPLTPVSDDPHDLRVLTPSHLLLLRTADLPFPSAPLGTTKAKKSMRRRWRQIQYLADMFWQRWTKEYLPFLTQRTKWQGIKQNARVGDVVVLVSRFEHRDRWPLGRIVAVHPGPDGLVRSVSVRTARTGVVERPINKICVLETEADPHTHVLN